MKVFSINALRTPAASATSAIAAALCGMTFLISMHAAAQTPDPAVPPPVAPASAPAPVPSPDIASAPAQRYAANDVKRAFNFMDSNHDGQLSRAEASGFKNVAKYFDAADANRDGLLSQVEFDDAVNGRRVQ